MAQLPTPFNAYNVDPSNSSGGLPISEAHGHLVIISASEFKASKNNPNNGYLELTLEIKDPSNPANGATGPYRINLFNENAQTVEIASKHLSAICHATGQMMVSDSAQLHNIPFRALVVAKPYKNDAGVEIQGTEVKKIFDVNGNPPKPVQSGAPAFAPAPVATQQPTFAAPAPAFAPPAAPAFAPPAAPASPTAPPWAR